MYNVKAIEIVKYVDSLDLEFLFREFDECAKWTKKFSVCIEFVHFYLVIWFDWQWNLYGENKEKRWTYIEKTKETSLLNRGKIGKTKSKENQRNRRESTKIEENPTKIDSKYTDVICVQLNEIDSWTI